VKKPGRKAGEDAWKIYKQEVKQRNLSRRFVQSMAELRATFDRAGAPKKVLVIVGDGSFCNRTILSGTPDLEKTPACASARPKGIAASIPKTSSLPIRFASTKTFPGKQRRSSMVANAAGSVIKK